MSIFDDVNAEAARMAVAKPRALPAREKGGDLLCVWKGCRGRLPTRLLQSNLFNLTDWQSDDDGGWERKPSKQRLAKPRTAGYGPVKGAERRGFQVEYHPVHDGLARLALPTHFHCPLNPDHVNTIEV